MNGMGASERQAGRSHDAGVIREQSSVGLARTGAYRWERRLPLSARWVSLSTNRLMTADGSRLDAVTFARSRRGKRANTGHPIERNCPERIGILADLAGWPQSGATD
jgi:hypothetical protein